MEFIYISTMKVLAGIMCAGLYYLYQKIENLESHLDEIKETLDEHEDFIYKSKSRKSGLSNL